MITKKRNYEKSLSKAVTFVLRVQGIGEETTRPGFIIVQTCYPGDRQAIADAQKRANTQEIATGERERVTALQIRYDCLPTRITILGFSLAFFGAVLYKFIRRRSELLSKALTTFKFLLEREAIEIEATKKEEKDAFDKNLKEIEEYLNNGDWTLAGLSCQQVMKEYDDFMTREWIEKKKITAKEGHIK